MRNKLLLIFLLPLLIQTARVNAQTSWTRLKDFPGIGRYAPPSFSINGKGYMGMGIDSTNNTHQDWYEYDPASNTWTAKNAFPGYGRWTSVCMVINGKGYIITGATIGHGLLTETWEYDPQTDTWTQKASLPATPRQNAFGFAIDTLGYLGGGFIGSSSSISDFWQYSPATDTWTQLSNYPGMAPEAKATFSMGGKGYAGLGCAVNGTAYYNELYEYDPSLATWTAKSGFPGPLLQSPFSATINDSGYVVSGINQPSTPGICFREVYKYVGPSDTWIQLDSFPGRGRGYSSGFAIGDTLFFGAGSLTGLGDSLLPDFWGSYGFPTGMQTLSNNDYSAYPNPTNTTLTITSTNSAKIASYELYDMTGRLIKSENNSIGKDYYIINLSEIEPSVYTLLTFDKDHSVLWKDKIVKR